jgi:hypothetical protein
MPGAGDFFFADDDGSRYFWRDEPDGGFAITMSSDVSAALDANKRARTVNDGYSRSRELRRAAHIPNAIILKWRDEGFDMFDPNNADELCRRLDSSDYAFLRTADGRLGRARERMV